MIWNLRRRRTKRELDPGDPNELYWGSAAFLIIAVVFVMKGVPAIKAAMKATSAKVEG